MTKIVGRLGPKVPDGEKKIYSLLDRSFRTDLNVAIYYEPFLIDEKPDFLMISKNLGVLVLEVKDYLEENLCTVSSTDLWTTIQDGVEIQIRNPFDQVYHYFRTINNMFSNIPNINCPIYPFVIFSKVSKMSEAGREIQSLKPTRILALYKEDLTKYKTFQEKFLEYIPRNLELSEEQYKLICGNLVPISRLPNIRQTKLYEIISDIDQLKLLDKEQERLAQNLGDGHRLFFGVAGSGKTVLAIARARYLALKHPNWRILLLCYNRILAKYLFKLMNPLEYKADITVVNFHKWAKDIIISAGQQYRRLYRQKEEENRKDLNQFFSDYVPQLLLQVLNEKQLRKYDAIIIDEAQDFNPAWFKTVMLLLNPETNSLLITCDGLQGIYKRKKFHWADVRIDARGRTKYLQKSYRSPAEIGKIANSVLPQELLARIETEEEFLATEEYVRPGGLVELVIKADRTTEYNYIIEKIKENYEMNQSTLIIFRKNMQKINYNHQFFSMLQENGLQWSDLNSWSKISTDIMVGTPQGTKGLESDVVFIPELDTYYRPSDRQLLYVGMTRALRGLVLSASKETTLIKELKRNLKNKIN